MIPTIDKFNSHAKGIVDSFKKEISSVRSNRPSASLIEDLKVSYYDQIVPIKHVGSIGITPPREIHIQVWDKGAISSIVRAIETSQLGLSAQVDGNIIRMYLPELSQERRDELIRYVKKVAEQYRIQIRHSRDEVNKQILKLCDDDEISEDEKFAYKGKVQDIVDGVNEDIEKHLSLKIKEINE